MVKYPDWLGDLTRKDEKLRSHHGLQPRRDGWHKMIDCKKRYIAKPMPLGDVVAILDARINEIRGVVTEKPIRLAINSTTIEDLVGIFLAHLWQRHTTGMPRKLERRTYDDYVEVLDRFVELVGPDNLAIRAEPQWFTKFARSIAKKAVSSRRREIIYLTAFFNWAGPGRHNLNFYKKPVEFGPDLVKPEESLLRAAMSQNNDCYTPAQYMKALTAVRECPMLMAIGLLGLNAAYLPSDLTKLPINKVDLDAGIVEFPRPKSGIERKTVLMPETVFYLRRYLAVRPQPSIEMGDAEPLFLRDDGLAFNQRIADEAAEREEAEPVRANHTSSLSGYWRAATGLPTKGLRTTFATNADDAEDQRAVDVVMGHAAKTVRQKHYVKHFDPQRLRKIVEHVWRRVVTAIPTPATASVSASSLTRSGRSASGSRASVPAR